MDAAIVSKHVQNLMKLSEPVYRFLTESAHASRIGDPGIYDFVYGNPHEMPIPEYSQALVRQVNPQNKEWFAYTMSQESARNVVADSLSRLHHISYQPEDIFLTTGAFGALAISLGTLVDPGDEVIFVSPPWFFYEAMISAHYGVPVRVFCDPNNHDLDLKAIADSISPRTRAIIVNTPNNPTGRIYPPATLQGLAELLKDASRSNGRPIVLLADESYNRIVYDGMEFHTPAAYYPNTFVIYTYGKTLLTPGQRIGYIALPPSHLEREALRTAIFMTQIISGWVFPNALLQHALPDLDKLSINIPHLQARRDRMVSALQEIGYELKIPEGTFYLLVRSPLQNEWDFIQLLEQQNVFCLPGSVFELPGYFRISLTANDEMVEKSLPGFEKAFQAAASGRSPIQQTAWQNPDMERVG